MYQKFQTSTENGVSVYILCYISVYNAI